jgi:uncharacterized protein (UPF0335 family)
MNQPREKTKTPVFNMEAVVNNPVTKASLQGFVEAIVGSKRDIKRIQQDIKDEQTQAKDSLGIPGKLLNKLVKESMVAGSLEADLKDATDASDMADILGIK